MYKLPERRGGGGGEGIRAMPERKHLFLNEVFPKTVVLYLGWIVGSLLLQLKELITLSLKYMLRNIAVVLIDADCRKEK